MAIWNGLTEEGAVVPIQVDTQGRVVVSGGGGAPSQVYGTAKAVGVFGTSGSTTFAMNCSCTRTGGGVYTVSFQTPFPDANYLPIALALGGYLRIAKIDTQTTTSVRVQMAQTNNTASDASFGIAVFDARPSDVTPLILPNSALQDIQRLKDAVGLADS